MPRYHINPSTGDSGLCHATVKCPFGDLESDHYPDRASAQKAYEKTRSALGKVAFNRALMPMSVAEELNRTPLMLDDDAYWDYEGEASPFACRSCQAPYTQEQSARLMAFEVEECYNCGSPHNIDTAKLEVLPKFEPIVADPSLAKRRTWTHATVRGPRWLSQVQQAEVEVHVGSTRAAIDRVLSEDHKLPGTAIVYFFEVQLEEDATVADEVEFDDDKEYKLQEKDVQVYLNRWEDPGSLALQVRAGKLKEVAVTEVPFSKIHQYATPYNLYREFE